MSLAPTDFHELRLEDVPLLMILPAADADVCTNVGARIYDRTERAPSSDWFKSQLYVHGAIHNHFSTEWRESDWEASDRACARGFRTCTCNLPHDLPHPADQLSQTGHQDMLRAWSRSFFALTLQGEAGFRPVLTGDGFVAGLENHRVFPSFQTSDARIVDHFEDFPDDPSLNTLRGSLNASAGFGVFDEFSFRQAGTDRFNATFFHETDGLVVEWPVGGDSLSSQIPPTHQDNSGFQYLSLRVTQVHDALSNPSREMVFRVGLSDAYGSFAAVESTAAGAVPYPYLNGASVKSMMHTLRIPLSCFVGGAEGPLQTDQLTAIQLFFDRTDQGTLGVDQIELSN